MFLLSVSQSITVDGSFEANSRPRFQAIAEDVLRVAQQVFEAPPPVDLPIVCRRDRFGPLNELDNWEHPTRVYVGINTVAPFYGQFVYQLAHEIGHVYLNPRRTNGAMESLATAFSFEALDRLAKRWETQAPFEYARLHAADLREYRESAERESLTEFPPEVREAASARRWELVRAYLRSHHRQLEQLSPVEVTSGRAWQALAAMTLRGAGPVQWKSLVNIGRCTDPPPSAKPALQYIPITAQCAPDALPW